MDIGGDGGRNKVVVSANTDVKYQVSNIRSLTNCCLCNPSPPTPPHICNLPPCSRRRGAVAAVPGQAEESSHARCSLPRLLGRLLRSSPVCQTESWTARRRLCSVESWQLKGQCRDGACWISQSILRGRLSASLMWL